MTNPIDRLPPQNTDAEEAVLGSILMAGVEALYTVRGDLDAADFYRERNAMIYTAMNAVARQRLPVDFVTVVDQLTRDGRLEEVGGVSYLSHLVSMVPTALHIEHYAGMVKRAAVRRKLISAAGRIAARAYDETVDLDTVLTESVGDLARVSAHSGGLDIWSPEAQQDMMIEWVSSLKLGKPPGIPTGFHRFDRLTGGLRAGALYVIGAPTGVGKTSWMHSTAHYLRSKGRRVLFASSEMAPLELAKRTTAALMGRDMNEVEAELLAEDVPPATIEATAAAVYQVDATAPHVYHGGSMTVDKIRRRALRLQADGGLDVLFVDYLQRLDDRDPTAKNREQQVSQIAKSLKTLAGDLSIPVVVAAQFSRACTFRPDGEKEPRLSDFRESGGIENESDVAMGLYRESRFKPEANPEEAWLYVMKNRHGQEGRKLKLRWLAATCTYAAPADEQGRPQ